MHRSLQKSAIHGLAVSPMNISKKQVHRIDVCKDQLIFKSLLIEFEQYDFRPYRHVVQRVEQNQAD